MPELVPPMQVSAGTGQPPTGPDWVVELAWTGHRCIAYVEPGRRTRLLSSGAVSMTAAYPELVPELERRSPPRGMVLDGTIVARGEEHAPRAARLQRRSARHRPSDRQIARVPVDFQVADLLWLDGHPTVDLAYRDRRALLEGLGFDAAPIWATSPMPVTELATLLHVAESKGVDALHARHLGSRYRPGQRSPLWVRVPVPRTGRVLIGGWTPVNPDQPDRVASLLVGVPDEGGRLRYVGRVGVTGEERRHVAGLRELRRDTSPFTGALPVDVGRRAIWVEPRAAGLVEFTGFTADGRLRLPLWRGLAGAGEGAVRWARRPPDAGEPVASAADPGLANGEGQEAEVGGRAYDAPAAGAGAGASAGAGAGAAAQSHGGGGAGSAARDGGEAEAGGGAGAGPAGDEGKTVGEAAAGPAGRGGGDAETGGGASAAPEADPEPARPPDTVETRRLEQHFVYNSLNTIASLIRTDPARARDLLMGFADLSRAADRAHGATSLGRELETVRRYLSLEQARFGRRLRVEIDVDPALGDLAVEPLAVLAAVRAAVQRDVEPHAQGGVLTVTADGDATGGVVTVTGGTGEPVRIVLPAARQAVPSLPAPPA